MNEARAIDAALLRSLRKQFENVTQRLQSHLAVINGYLAAGAPPFPSDDVTYAMRDSQDLMNQTRHLVSQIEAITQDAERTEPRRHRK